MLNKRNLAVAQFASKEASRWVMQAIKVDKDATVATDGHRLVWVSKPSSKSVDFPTVDGFEGGQDDASFLLDADAAKAIEKVIPKSKIPILNNAAVRVDGEQAIVCVTNLDNPQVFKPRPVSGQYPNFDMVMPKDAPTFQIAVNAEYLAQIAKFAAQFSDNHKVVLSFYGTTADNKPMRFDASDGEQGMTAVLMPLRDGAKATMVGTYGHVEPTAEPEPVEAAAESSPA